MYDITAIGEGAVDLTVKGKTREGNILFEAVPGGAPCTMLAAAAKLGLKVVQNGVVGDDRFGDIIVEALEKAHIDTHGIKRTNHDFTHIVGVSLDDTGNRSFFPLQKDSVLYKMSDEFLDYELVDNCRILHIAGAMFFKEDSLSTMSRVIERRYKRRLPISCDINWRPGFYDREYARSAILPLLRKIDMIKVAEEEYELFTETSDYEYGSSSLLIGNVKLIITTLGDRGCYFRTHIGTGQCNTYDTAILNTTGAGDAFFGALHYCILKEGRDLSELPLDILTDYVDFANAAGALSASRPGSIGDVPSLADIEECRRSVYKLII